MIKETTIKHTKTFLQTPSGQCLTSDAELRWRRDVVLLWSARDPYLRRKWAGFLQTRGLICSWRRKKVHHSIQNIKVVDNCAPHATCVCRPRCLFDCESMAGNPLLARSSSATQHAATGCQGIPCPLRQTDAWLAMVNSSGEDLMSLSFPIGLQIVAEKLVDLPPSGGLGWPRKSSALCSKASSSSTLWWRPPFQVCLSAQHHEHHQQFFCESKAACTKFSSSSVASIQHIPIERTTLKKIDDLEVLPQNQKPRNWTKRRTTRFTHPDDCEWSETTCTLAYTRRHVIAAWQPVS